MYEVFTHIWIKSLYVGFCTLWTLEDREMLFLCTLGNIDKQQYAMQREVLLRRR